jgi:hypothetical protein
MLPTCQDTRPASSLRVARSRNIAGARPQNAHTVASFSLALTGWSWAIPFGLFRATQTTTNFETVLIYPRVVQLPEVALPRGGADAHARRRRSMMGARPAASVRDYAAGDSMRLVHWPTTAHRGRLTVKELEQEPSGDVWIVLDLDAAVQQGAGAEGTLEYWRDAGREHGCGDGFWRGSPRGRAAGGFGRRRDLAGAAAGTGAVVGDHGRAGAGASLLDAAARSAAPQLCRFWGAATRSW